MMSSNEFDFRPYVRFQHKQFSEHLHQFRPYVRFQHKQFSEQLELELIEYFPDEEVGLGMHFNVISEFALCLTPGKQVKRFRGWQF